MKGTTSTDAHLVAKFSTYGLKFLTLNHGWTADPSKAWQAESTQEAAKRLWAGDIVVSLTDALASVERRAGAMSPAARDLEQDKRVLWRFFNHSQTRFIGSFGLGELGLKHSPEALVLAGLLVGATLGRFNDGYRPGPKLEPELTPLPRRATR